MKRWIFAVLIVLLVSGTAAAKNYEVTKKAGEYNLIVTIDKNPPATGDNQLTVSARDGAGAEVTDAKVAVEYSMPPMHGMPPMKYSTPAEWTGKGYRAKINFSMSGSWNIIIKITRADKTAQVRFTVDAR